jgi:hypothetical protein
MPDRAQQIPLLTEGLLEQLAARWRTHGLLIVESLRPGLSDAEMDELTEPLGIVLPREARTWWRWHDGASTEGGGSCNLGPLRLYSPLSDAVRIDCGVGFEEAVPARYYRFEEPETGAEGVPSMGALVLLYIDAFDRGLWSFDRVRGTWSSDRSKLDAVTRDLHLT